MRSIIPLIILAACTSSPKKPERDPVPIANDRKSDVIVHPIHHSALVLQWEQHAIYIDPHDSVQRFSGLPAPDLILITDIHGDHLDTTTLRALDLSKARIIAPPSVKELLPQDLQPIADTLRNGETMNTIGVQVEAIPMYNLPEEPGSRHPKGRGNGYVITLGDQRIYVSGDTEDIPEMRALKGIDIAFVCMNLPYTMDVDQAASAVLEFKPEVVYPYHYRGRDGFSDIDRFEQLVKAGDAAIEVVRADWY